MDLGTRAALAIDNARTHAQLRAKTVELEMRAAQLREVVQALETQTEELKKLEPRSRAITG